jgi:hypothetical protein
MERAALLLSVPIRPPLGGFFSNKKGVTLADSAMKDDDASGEK